MGCFGLNSVDCVSGRALICCIFFEASLFFLRLFVELGYFYIGRCWIWQWAFVPSRKKENLPMPILGKSQSFQVRPVYLGIFSGGVFL